MKEWFFTSGWIVLSMWALLGGQILNDMTMDNHKEAIESLQESVEQLQDIKIEQMQQLLKEASKQQ